MLNSTRRFTFIESLLQNFISFFTLTNVPLDDLIPFYRKQFSLSFNKTGKLQFSTLYILSVVRVLITLLIKQ